MVNSSSGAAPAARAKSAALGGGSIPGGGMRAQGAQEWRECHAFLEALQTVRQDGVEAGQALGLGGELHWHGRGRGDRCAD
eukprot:1169283-Amphidinium_carterae.1